MKSQMKNLSFLSLFVSLLFFINYINMTSFPFKSASKRKALKKVKKRLYEYKQEVKQLENSEWKSYQVDKSLKAPEPSKNDWSYKWFIVKHDNGFENITSDTVLAQDTVHLIHNSWCNSFLVKKGIVFSDTLSDLNLCRYQELEDNLKIEIYEESVSNGEVLRIDLKQDKFNIDYETGYVFPYKRISWKFKEKQLTLNKKLPIKRGDTLIGKVEVKFEERIFYKEPKPFSLRTKIIKGIFKLKVE